MNTKANEKRLTILRAIHDLSDDKILSLDSATFEDGDPTAVIFSHGGTHPPTPPPPPPP